MARLIGHRAHCYEATTQRLDGLVERGLLPDIPVEHLYYIIAGAGPTMFVLDRSVAAWPGWSRPTRPWSEAHADAVCRLIFGR